MQKTWVCSLRRAGLGALIYPPLKMVEQDARVKAIPGEGPRIGVPQESSRTPSRKVNR